jgi:hypothetical protein
LKKNIVEIERLNNLSYDVWIYAQGARDALRSGKVEKCQEQLDKIKRLLTPAAPDRAIEAPKDETRTVPFHYLRDETIS